MIKKNFFRGAVSPHKDYCDGFGSPGTIGQGYVIAPILKIGKDKIKFSHSGSDNLDEINVFDLAEAEGTYIGQINIATVSSFCGYQGLIWGYDIAYTDIYRQETCISGNYINLKQKNIPIYSLSPIIEAAGILFGTRDKKIFPLKPGSHVPCATKHIISNGNKIIYCSLGFGIPEDRYQSAVTITEDIGCIPSIEEYKSVIMDNLVKSILQIGYNQNINYNAVYVAGRFLQVNEGELGCALVAVPYFSLAQNAVPSGNVEDLEKMNLSEWADTVLKHRSFSKDKK